MRNEEYVGTSIARPVNGERLTVKGGTPAPDIAGEGFFLPFAGGDPTA